MKFKIDCSRPSSAVVCLKSFEASRKIQAAMEPGIKSKELLPAQPYRDNCAENRRAECLHMQRTDLKTVCLPFKRGSILGEQLSRRPGQGTPALL